MPWWRELLCYESRLRCGNWTPKSTICCILQKRPSAPGQLPSRAGRRRILNRNWSKDETVPDCRNYIDKCIYLLYIPLAVCNEYIVERPETRRELFFFL